MLRVHFTADDLVRTRVAAVGPLDETACAIWLLQRRDSAVFFDGWRQQTLARLMPAARLLGAMIPPMRCVSLDVFTLSGGPSNSLDHALENLRGCPADDLRAEAQYADQSRPLRAWASGLTVADAEARNVWIRVSAPHTRHVSRPTGRGSTSTTPNGARRTRKPSSREVWTTYSDRYIRRSGGIRRSSSCQHPRRPRASQIGTWTVGGSAAQESGQQVRGAGAPTGSKRCRRPGTDRGPAGVQVEIFDVEGEDLAGGSGRLVQ